MAGVRPRIPRIDECVNANKTLVLFRYRHMQAVVVSIIDFRSGPTLPNPRLSPLFNNGKRQ